MYVNPGQVVDDMQIEVAVKESREITEIEAMTRVLDNDVYIGMPLFCIHVFVVLLNFYHNNNNNKNDNNNNNLIIIIYCDVPLYNEGTYCRPG